MRRLLAALVLASALMNAAAIADGRAQVMIVGVAHLAAHNDVHNTTFRDDLLGLKMQAQIKAVVDALGAFRPTKVMVEAPFGAPRFAQRYSAYRAGKYSLGTNEIYQFGFRLAAQAGNSTIYPIDDPGPQPNEKDPQIRAAEAYLEKSLPHVEDQDSEFRALVSTDDKLAASGDLLAQVRFLNSEDALRANAGWYTLVDRLGADHDNAGALYAEEWYARNLRIYAHIVSSIAPNDRVVVIIGQGHKYLLRDLIALSPDLRYVDCLDYLPTAK